MPGDLTKCADVESFNAPQPISRQERIGYWVESDQAIRLLEQYRLPIPNGYRFLNSERVQFGA